MRITRIYFNGDIRKGETLTLPANASNHLVRVMRCHKGSAVTVFNGCGGEFAGTLTDGDPQAATVGIDDFIDVERESPLQITLLQGISRGEHMDTTVRKATELGVTAILPLSCERSVPIKREHVSKKQDRWQQIAVSACEQSGRNHLPDIQAAAGVDEALERFDAGTKLVLDPAAPDSVKNLELSDRTIGVLCGPEGGLSEREMSAAADAGYIRICFGPRILRTETAGPAMIAALQTLWGDMG